MSRLDEIRGLRDKVVQMEGCAKKMDGSERRLQKKAFLKKKRVVREEEKQSRIGFKKWMKEVVSILDEESEIDVDEYEDFPWRDWYYEGVSSKKAARKAMDDLEAEVEDEDEEDYEDDDVDPGDDEEVEDVEDNPSLRKRSGSHLRRGLDELSQALGLKHRKPKKYNEDEIQEDEDESEPEGENDSEAVIESEDSESQGEPEEDVDNIQDAPESNSDMDAIAVAAEAIRTTKRPGETSEARVSGGDWGRWGLATKAASEKADAISKAISSATEKKYDFKQTGKASSSESGSELWFEAEPDDSGDDVYYLGFKIHGEGEDTSWDVMMRRGKGLGSAKSVAAEKSVSGSELSSAIGKLLDRVKE